MSGVTRRAVLAGAATAGAAATLVFRAGGAEAPALAIFDSRLPEARAFAIAAKARGVPLHDVASEDEDLWRSLRGLTHTPGQMVVGMTGWTDWVSIRGVLAAQGLRVRHETKIRSLRRSTATMFEWALA